MLVGTSYFNNGKTAILRSTDNGNTFSVTEVTSQFKAHGNGMGRQNGEKLIVDPNNGNILYCGTRENGMFKSTNAGVNWSRLSGLNVTTTPHANGVSFVVADGSSVSGGATQRLFAGILTCLHLHFLL
jgi:xyloglucan-specific exo-beta-1,4-glucanase